MQLLKKRGILVFWIFLLIECYLIFSRQTYYASVVKIMLVPILLFYVFLNARKNHYQTTKTLVFFGLLASWVGDILLINNGDVWFILGMIAFMATHIIYATIFYRIHRLRLYKSQEAFIAAIILFIVCYYLFRFLNTNSSFEPFKIPIILYMIVISIMAIMAVNILGTGSRKQNAINYFIPGAVLFIISDATLSVQKFVFPDENFLSVIIMLSYGYAQSLIAEGFSKTLKS